MAVRGSKSSSELKSLRSKAAEFNRDGRWDTETIELNSMIAALDSTDAAAFSRRAKCYWLRGDLEAARADYESALALCSEGDSVTSHIRQAISDIADEATARAESERLQRQEHERLEREKKEELARQRELLATLASCDEALYVARENRYGENPDPGFVLGAYRRAAELDPGRLDVGVEWAALLRDLGHNENASALYERILQRQPTNRAACVGKAALLVDSGHEDAGLSICEEVLAKYPEDGYARKVKARVHAARGEMTEAIWHYEQAGED